MDGEPSSAQLAVMLATATLSLASLFYLFQKHIGGSPLLKYEPRYRVPWGGIVAMLSMTIPLIGVLTFFAELFIPETVVEDASIVVKEEISHEQQLIEGWGNVVFMLGAVAVLIVALKNILHAELRDFGLSGSRRQLARDCGIGLLAALASLLPMFIIQLVLLNIWPPEEQHPLIERLRENNTPAMMAMSFALAVIAAPLFEEFIFRGLFQGWLERREDKAVGNVATLRLPLSSEIETVSALGPETVAGAQAEQESLMAESAEETQSPRGWFLQLPHGWGPILISATVFGLAHLGHGLDPVPLVLFGIVLGYLYQRTHRLVPCIAAHMFFNGYSMLQLWLQLSEVPAS